MITALFVFDVGAFISLVALHVCRQGRHWSGMVSRRGSLSRRLTVPRHRR
jgi:hypothetical protein